MDGGLKTYRLSSGQYTGEFEFGRKKGRLIVNIDHNRLVGSLAVLFKADESGLVYSGELILPDEYNTPKENLPENLKNFYVSDVTYEKDESFLLANKGELEFEEKFRVLFAVFESDEGKNEYIAEGKFTLGEHPDNKFKIELKNTSEFVDSNHAHINQVTWREFKNIVFDKIGSNKNYIYRGQDSSEYILKSSFHRLGRNCLINLEKDFVEVERVISRYLDRKFNLNEPDDYSELMFLAQHYGYPTPLLDFTKSPFVAAYFAFNNIPPLVLQNKKNVKKRARIYVVNTEKLHQISRASKRKDFKNKMGIVYQKELRQMHNFRVGPQQGICLFSSLPCLEVFLSNTQESLGDYVWAYDILLTERDEILKDLSAMGITAESLFPGIEGAFNSLKMRHFGFNEVH